MEALSRLCINDAPSITIYGLNNSIITTYGIEESKFTLNSAWNNDLLREELLRLKSMEFGIYLLGFDPKKKAITTLGCRINHP